MELQEPLPSSSPTHSILLSSSEDSSRPNQKIRSLREPYEVTNELHLICLFTDCEPLKFEDATQDKRWKDAMDEEIKVI